MADTFLTDILGMDGSRALEKAVERAPMLKAVIVPRAVVAWLSTMGKLGFDGELPGTPDSYFSLIKQEDEKYAGALTINDQLYTFEDADILHVAASVGVALGIELEPITEQMKKKDLTQLGKSIDLLVKSEIIKKLKALKKAADEENGIGEPGPHHAPTEPKAQEEPQAPSMQSSAPKNGIPVNKDNLALGQGQHKLIVTKAESERTCEECGKTQFKDKKFEGCMCLSELSKSIVTEVIATGFVLKFKKDLDTDAISTVVEVFKG